MKKRWIYTMLLSLIAQLSFAQQEKPDWGIRWSGFVKTDVFYDTRQSSPGNGIREGHFFLFPDNVSYDADSIDLNSNGAFHILNIQTRIRADLSGPDAFGARTTGAIEAEFFGTNEADLNGFRLRHAYVRMDWNRTALLAGQFWHPMFPAENFPGTISFNTGAPFTPFSRNPQLRLIHKMGRITTTLTAYTQRDFTSFGPDGAGSKYIRNSQTPGMNLQFKFPVNDHFTLWTGMDYKSIRPEIRTTKNYETNSLVESLAAFASIKVKAERWHVSMMGVYAQNATDLMMIGGYGVSRTKDSTRMIREYVSITTANALLDMSFNGKRYAAGLFAGYSKNLGAPENLNGPVYSRGADIDHLLRVSPRFTATEGRLTLAAEMENTWAAYGKIQKDGRVDNTKTVLNTRFLLSAIYKF
ncbi:MAG TPA: hypothetical protein PLE85_09250 [Bacteroidales bacterium]|nr:hypothetical protein [Bacteroidales bacterium]